MSQMFALSTASCNDNNTRNCSFVGLKSIRGICLDDCLDRCGALQRPGALVLRLSALAETTFSSIPPLVWATYQIQDFSNDL